MRMTARLDSPVFWSLLPPGQQCSPWQELTGPGDPLLLAGTYLTSQEDPSCLQVHLQASNR